MFPDDRKQSFILSLTNQTVKMIKYKIKFNSLLFHLCNISLINLIMRIIWGSYLKSIFLNPSILQSLENGLEIYIFNKYP